MTAIITNNNLKLNENSMPPAPLLKDDGSNYKWRMFFNRNSKIAEADTIEEMIDVLIPGYANLASAEEKYQARIAMAKHVQLMCRVNILGAITPEEADNIADWEWAVLTYGDEENTDPYGWGYGDGTLGVPDIDSIDYWKSEYPLVLLETTYKPFTEISCPISNEGDYTFVKNIIWLRVESSEEFLRSLSRVGYIIFGKASEVH